MSNGWDWIGDGFARRMDASTPSCVRPLLPAIEPPRREPLDLPRANDGEMQQLRDAGQRMEDGIQTSIAAMARRRREQVEAHIERHREAIEALQARGIRVWLEEGPANFTTEQGDQWTMRATSTVRIRWEGDGQ
jgi:hypothetical protein